MYREGCFATPCPDCGGPLRWNYETDEMRRNADYGAIKCNTCRREFPLYDGFPTKEPVFETATKVLMTQERADRIAFLFLQALFEHYMSGSEEFNFPEEFTDEEFFTFLEMAAPKFFAKIAAECDAEWNPLDHFDEVLKGAGALLRERDEKALKPGQACPAPGCKGKLEWYTEHGINLFGDNLTCSECHGDFPRYVEPFR